LFNKAAGTLGFIHPI